MHCLNCQNEFQGDYCPRCGQSAATRRFTIKNALSSTLEVWGMGNRSLPRTLWHLFRRPGIMIGEYLDGKRIPFFPPVKMLFVLCVFYALLQPVMERGKDPVQSDLQTEINAHRKATAASSKEASEEEKERMRMENTAMKVVGFVKDSMEWLQAHKAVQLLCLHSFFMVFACWLFRKSPLRPRTNLAENFYAQVYMSCQLTALSIPYALIFAPKGSTFDFYPLPSELMLIVFVWDFKQLFGFGWRTTIKKTILLTILSITALCATVAIIVAAAALLTGATGE